MTFDPETLEHPTPLPVKEVPDGTTFAVYLTLKDTKLTPEHLATAIHGLWLNEPDTRESGSFADVLVYRCKPKEGP